jgi:hypothetical protein
VSGNDDWDAPDHWDPDERDMWDDFVELDPRLGNDDYAQIMFHEAYFDREVNPSERDDFHDSLAAYLAEHYDIDFDEVFDWEDYRDWYES